MENMITPAKLEVILSLSNLGATSHISKVITLFDFKMCLSSLITISGFRPKVCVELTPGAKEAENTSEQIVTYI